MKVLLLLLLLLLLLFPAGAYAECHEFTFAPNGLICTENPHKLRDQLLADVFVVAASAADCYTTRIAVSHGAVEANPFMKPFARNFGACMGVKAAFFVPAITYGWQHDSVKAQLIIGTISGSVAVWNRFQW